MKNRKYLDWVRAQPCVICARTDRTTPHHAIACHGTGKVGGKSANDLETFPLCEIDDGDLHSHTALHDDGAVTWERRFGEQWMFVAKTLINAIFQGVLKVNL